MKTELKVLSGQKSKKAEKIYSSLKGTLLSICSKNNKNDVVEVLEKKKFIKKLFFPIIANLKTKSSNIKEIQKKLKVSFHNILFVDNNISEVIEVKKKIPDINIFWSNNSEALINCLKYYPNLTDYFNSNTKSINNKRILDLKASLKREKIIKDSKNNNHFSILKMKIDYRLNNKKEFDRIFSLTNKVNQFIFSYKRFSKNKVKEYIENPNKFVFTIALKDRFSDSGNIGVIFFTKTKNTIYLDELCISCRALGRNLEDYFIFYPLIILSKKIKFNTFIIDFVNGPKNLPAKKYFKDLKKKFLKKKSNSNKLKIFFSRDKNLLFRNKDFSLNFKN